MAACHLVTHLQLTLLSNIDFGQFDDARWQLVSNGNLEFPALVCSKDVVVLQVVIVNHSSHQPAVVFISDPTIAVDCQVIQAVQDFLSELHSLLDLLFLVVVVDALANLASDKLHQLLYQHLFQSCCLNVKFFIDGLQDSLVSSFGFSILDGT